MLWGVCTDMQHFQRIASVSIAAFRFSDHGPFQASGFEYRRSQALAIFALAIFAKLLHLALARSLLMLCTPRSLRKNPMVSLST